MAEASVCLIIIATVYVLTISSHSQKTCQHPLPIDFFPWPALRDRLVRHHKYYFATNEFSVNYRQHFKFSWPFKFEDTYRYDYATHMYTISPLFERYHRDMECWALEEVFFQKFPELIGEISVYEVGLDGASDRSSLLTDINAHTSFATGEVEHRTTCIDEFGAVNCDIGNEDVMELFVSLALY